MGMARRLFGPSRREMWTKLADEMHGKYVDEGWFGSKFPKGEELCRMGTASNVPAGVQLK